MITKYKFLALCGLVAAFTVVWAARATLRARHDLVTLDVRDMDVDRVIRKIEWQTWERIISHKTVRGKITLNVRKMPLPEVLRIVGEQTSSRASVLYPLYSKRSSLANLQKALRGDLDPMTHGWTNLLNRGPFRGGSMPPGGGGKGEAPVGGQVSLEIVNQDVFFAALAFTRFARAWVVPEDGSTALVTLRLDKASLKTALATLAKKAHRNWAQIYALRREERPGGAPPQLASQNSTRTDPGRPGVEMTEAERQQIRSERAALEEELKRTLPAAEREQMELVQQEREQQFKQMQTLTPEQRRDRGMRANDPGMSKRLLERVKNTTPEQRAEQRRHMTQMRQAGPPGSMRGQGPRSSL